MQVQFVDLTTTIYVKRGLFSSNTKLKSVLDFFTDKWMWKKISVNGFPIKQEDLDANIGRFGFSNIEIELHR